MPLYLFMLVISSLTCNLLSKTLKSRLHHWCMNTTYFDQHLSSSGVSELADETAVLPSVSLIFGLCPDLCAHGSYGDW
jgi:hypothetical protein